MNILNSIINEIERDIERFTEQKEDAIKENNLSDALTIDWAISGLYKVLTRLNELQRKYCLLGDKGE